MRIDKYLSHMGFGTRSQVKNLIKNGWVTIDDKTIKKSDIQIKEGQIVCVDDKPVSYVEHEYYMLYKPSGYVSATEDNLHPTIMELVDCTRNDLYPVGRLDIDTEGLLLVTNDGQFTHNLLSPKKHVSKKYYVEFEEKLPEDAIEIFSKPMEFEDFTSLGSKLEIINEHSAYLTIYEGKFHQVKRMFLKVGCQVTYLKRVAFGPLTLGDLELGQSRKLTEEELKMLQND